MEIITIILLTQCFRNERIRFFVGGGGKLDQTKIHKSSAGEMVLVF